MHDTIPEVKTRMKYKTWEWAEKIVQFPFLSPHEGNTDTESEARILTQEEVDEWTKNYNPLLTRELENSAGLIRKKSNGHWPNLFLCAGTSASSTAASP